jgi:NTE family protein
LITGNAIVDGGVLSNFPIRLVAEPVPQIMGDTDRVAALNLGLLLDEALPVPSTSTSRPTCATSSGPRSGSRG